MIEAHSGLVSGLEPSPRSHPPNHHEHEFEPLHRIIFIFGADDLHHVLGGTLRTPPGRHAEAALARESSWIRLRSGRHRLQHGSRCGLDLLHRRWGRLWHVRERTCTRASIRRPASAYKRKNKGYIHRGQTGAAASRTALNRTSPDLASDAQQEVALVDREARLV